MRKVIYDRFIPQNIAPYTAETIIIFDSDGNEVEKVGLGHLKMPELGTKLYSFGALSDVHISYDTAETDFQVALSYLNKTEDVAFTLICGDLTGEGTDAQYELYKSYVDTYSADTPVYPVSGNHDGYYEATESLETDYYLTDERFKQYTGLPIYYTISNNPTSDEIVSGCNIQNTSVGNDVFIMFGMRRWNAYRGGGFDVFGSNEIGENAFQWLEYTLESNKDKRIFLFQHLLRLDGCGNPLGFYTNDILNNEQGERFKALISTYPNVIWFHGHSHSKFDLQEEDKTANYDELFNIKSIHVPSLAVPKDVEDGTTLKLYAESEGYIVDVYENHIVLRGRDFANEKFLPIATYCLET